jgi:biotin carboxyl carrier protein
VSVDEAELPAVGPGPDVARVAEITRGLADLVREHRLARLCVAAGGVSWEIEGAAVPAPPPAPAIGGPPAVPEEPVPTHQDVLAPLVGVFARSPARDRPPYVEVGDAVSPGQRIAHVEAMRMRTDIVAERAGVLREVHAVDGEIVEFGQRLATVGPA